MDQAQGKRKMSNIMKEEILIKEMVIQEVLKNSWTSLTSLFNKEILCI
jgi:hypothetical protein